MVRHPWSHSPTAGSGAPKQLSFLAGVREDPASPLRPLIAVDPSELLFALKQLPQDEAATVRQLLTAAERLAAQAQATRPISPAIVNPDQLITTEELAGWLRESVSTIHHWRVSGKGPRFVRKPKHVVYRVRDVQDWLDRQTVSSTSEVGARRNRRRRK